VHVLVTGGLGFLEIVGDGGYDAVCHLAALTRVRDSFADPLTYYDVNVGGTLNILMALDAARVLTGLDAAREAKPAPRVVFASTYLVYGSQHIGALSEDMEPHPESPYAASKVSAEQLIAAYAATGAIGAVTLRCFNIAGAADGVTDTDTARIIPNVFRALAGESAHVTLNGDGAAVRDFVHVLDVAQAVRLSLTSVKAGENRVYNIGSGIGTSMAQVVEVAAAVTGRSVVVKKMPPKPEPRTLTADNSRAVRDLGLRLERSELHNVIVDAWRAWSTTDLD
jgi:UDP-glucose 4-epimerase